jgi:hypothetical protein
MDSESMSSRSKFLKDAATLALLSSFCLLPWLACGPYSFSGSLAPHLKTVTIAPFENLTAEFGIAEEMTNTLTDEFHRDNTLKLGDRSLADILVEGVIARVEDSAGAYTQSEQVQDFKIYITARVKCTDQVKRQVLWEERITQWGTYDPSAGPESRADGMAEAIDKISQEVLNKTVAGW